MRVKSKVSPLKEKETGAHRGRLPGGSETGRVAAAVRILPHRGATARNERAHSAPTTEETMAKTEPARKADRKPDQFIDQMPLSSLSAPTWNRDAGDVTELAESIKAKGVLQAILVTPRGKRFVVAAGNRRWAAAKLAGLTHVPAIVREMTDDDILDVIVVENLQRKDITPVEEAQAFKLLSDRGRTTREIAERIGCGQSHVVKRLALLKLPAEVLKRVGVDLSLSDAGQLVELADHPKHLKKVLESNHIGYSIQRAKEAIKAEVTRKATRAMAKANGWPVLVGGDQWQFRPPEGAWRLGKDEWGALDIDPKKHAKEPCHAIGLCPRTGKPVPCCTDRSRHPGVLTRGERETQASGGTVRDSTWETHRAEWDEASAARWEIAGAARPKAPDIMKLQAVWWIEGAGGKLFAEVLTVLGYEVPDGLEKSWARTEEQEAAVRATRDKLIAACEKSGEYAARLCWLMLARRINNEYGDPRHNAVGTEDRMFVRLLGEAGYIPLDCERENLENQDSEAA